MDQIDTSGVSSQQLPVSEYRPPESAPSGPLSRNDVATLAVRIIGLYTLVQSLPMLSGVFYIVQGLRTGTMGEYFRLYFVPYLPTALFGAFLVAKGGWLGRWLLPPREPGDDSTPLRAGREMQSLAFAVVGLWMVIGAMEFIRRGFVRYEYDLRQVGERVDLPMWPAVRGDFTPAALLIIAGVWLFVGAKGVSAWWNRIRHPDLREPPL